MSDYTVAISSDFFSSFAALPKQKQGRVMDFVSKFRSNPTAPGINLEKIHDAYDKNMRSARIDDTYRAIVMQPEDGNVYLVLWVDHHDEAYAWARKKRCIVNQATGSIQIFESKPVEDETPSSQKMLFSDVADSDLLRLGVPQEQIYMIRSIADEQALAALKGLLPNDAYEALEWMQAGFSVDEVVAELYGDTIKKQSIGNDFDAALLNPVTQMQFTIVDGEDELKTMMNAPLDKWRVFLHPSQRRIVSKNYNGPARVLGGAGTGKTVVAMHRARFLSSHIPNDQKILFTTFTANLAEDIRENLRKICSIEEMRRIDVIHLDEWVHRFLKEQDYNFKIAYGDVVTEIWANAAAAIGDELDLPEGFYEDEWQKVVQAQGIDNLQEYAKAARNGRGVRLDRKKRIAVWKVFDEYRTMMNVRQLRDAAWAMNECTQIIHARIDYQPYAAIIVDESQDFGMSAFKLLQALAGKEHLNDIFLVGDAHQRIYKHKVVLSKCGIYVQGRSCQLRINYRTTEEIRRWAMGILNGAAFDDLDDGIDEGKGYKSLVHGVAPTVESFQSLSEESESIIQKIKALISEGTDPMNICIVTRTNKLLDDYAIALSAAGIRSYEIKRSKGDDRSLNGVRLATMHRVKGLEFEHVFLVAINQNILPLKAAISTNDPVSEAEALTGERCLMYVALTRAKKVAYISSYGKPSPFITVV